MIPRDYITSWRAKVPWVQDFQIEQDLVISRALVEIYSKRDLSAALAFRGGTALYKLHMKNEGKHITRALFERNLAEKRKSAQFSADITPLLASGYTWDQDRAADAVLTRMIALLPGAPWKKPKK